MYGLEPSHHVHVHSVAMQLITIIVMSFIVMYLHACIGEPPSSDVCSVRGAQGLDVLARVHSCVKVQGEVPRSDPHWVLSYCLPSYKESLHVGQGSRHCS